MLEGETDMLEGETGMLEGDTGWLEAWKVVHGVKNVVPGTRPPEAPEQSSRPTFRAVSPGSLLSPCLHLLKFQG